MRQGQEAQSGIVSASCRCAQPSFRLPVTYRAMYGSNPRRLFCSTRRPAPGRAGAARGRCGAIRDQRLEAYVLLTRLARMSASKRHRCSRGRAVCRLAEALGAPRVRVSWGHSLGAFWRLLEKRSAPSTSCLSEARARTAPRRASGTGRRPAGTGLCWGREPARSRSDFGRLATSGRWGRSRGGGQAGARQTARRSSDRAQKLQF